MELIETVLCYIFGLTNVILLLYVVNYIYDKRKTYPYNKTTPLCSVFFIFCVFIHQLLALINSWIVYRDNLEWLNIFKSLSSINTHLFMFIPLYFRMNILCNLVKYSFYHLTYHSQSPSFNIKESDEYFLQRRNKPNQDFIAFKYSIISYTFSIIVAVILLMNENTKCIIYMFFTFTKRFTIEMECKYSMRYQTIISSCLKNLFFTAQMFLFAWKSLEMMKYPIKNDKYLIRLEIIINASWFVFHDIYHLSGQFIGQFTQFTSFVFNDVIDFSFVVMHLFLMHIRKNMKTKNTKPQYVSIINKYSLFMRNYICFTYFKTFIQEERKTNFKHKEYLNFWVDYYLYKLHLKRPNILKKTDLIIHAYYLYSNYFSKNQLEVPIDTLTKIEKGKMKGFCMTRTELDDIFDEPFRYIDNKLNNIYVEMLNNRKHNRKLMNMLAHTEFDEIKENVVEENMIEMV